MGQRKGYTKTILGWWGPGPPPCLSQELVGGGQHSQARQSSVHISFQNPLGHDHLWGIRLVLPGPIRATQPRDTQSQWPHVAAECWERGCP